MSTPTLKPSSTQEPTRPSVRHTMLIIQQNRNTTLNIKIWVTQSHTKCIDTSKHTTGHFIALQREEIQIQPPEHSHKLTQPGNLDKPLVQPHPQGADSTIKRSHKFPACIRRASQTQQSTQNEKAKKYAAGEGT